MQKPLENRGLILIRLCEKCRVMEATERHHRYSQTKLNRKLYKDYIDRPENIQYLCYDCHHQRPLDKLTEKEFCDLFKIKLRSKSGKQKYEK